MSVSGDLVVNLVTEAWSYSGALLPHVVSDFSRNAGALLITAIWQSMVVAACLAISLRMTNRISAALRFTIWTAGFLAAVGLPFLPMFLHFGGMRFAEEGSRFASGGTGAWLQLDVRWSIALTVLWAAASLYRVVDLALHSVRLRRLWKSAVPVMWNADHGGGTSVSHLWKRGPVQVCTTKALDRPSVIGLFAPRILIPDWLYEQLTPGELDQILLHETEHLRRGDDWTNLLQKLSLIFFPLNPVLLWIERRLCLEREMACDEAVIRATGAPRSYATCLTNLAERGLQRRAEALSLGALERRPELVQRVHSILKNRPTLGPVGNRSVLAVLAGGLVFGSVELARCPQLVAFNSARPEIAQLPQLPRFATQTPHAVGMMNASVVQAASANAHHMASAGEPYLTDVKATVPVRASVPRLYSDVVSQTATHRSATNSIHEHLVAKDMPIAPASPSAKESLDAQMTPADHDAQGWVVLTSWEEVTSTNSEAQEIAQTDAHTNSAVAEPSSANPKVQMANPSGKPTTAQVTVRQLVLRVVPANSSSPSPAAISIRSSWFVFQL